MTRAQLVRLRDLGEWTGGNTPSKANPAYWTEGTVPWVSPKDMKVDEITSSEDRITEAALKEGRVSLVPEGSVLLVTRSGILAHTFPLAVTRVPVTINQDLKALTPRVGVLPKYVAHALRGASRRILKECSKHGTTVASIETNALLDFEIPLVAINAQQRIVAEIEKQFSRLDEAAANLKRVKANLRRYKAAVLKAAVEGRLVPTEAEVAGSEGRGYETGEQLLRRIGEARSSERTGRRKSHELSFETPKHVPLPDGWVWTTYGQVGRLQLGRQRAPKYHTGPNMRPYLRVQNVFEDRLDLSDVMAMEFSPADYEKYALVTGDLLLNEGQSPELLGRPAIYRGELPGSCFTNTLIRLRAAAGVRVEFALLVARHHMHAGRFVDEGSITTNIAHLSVGRLAAVEFPLPPTAEQNRIVAEADRQLSIIAALEKGATLAELQIAKLRAAILQHAYPAAAHMDSSETTSCT